MSSHLVAIASAELALHLKISIPDDPKRVDAAARLLRVDNVRLEAPVRAEASPSTLLKFDVFNGTSTPLTDLVLEISILEKPAITELSGRSVVRPFKIRGGPSYGV